MSAAWILGSLLVGVALYLLAVTRSNLRPILTEPGHVAYHGGADPWKNVYTPSYHALHDKAWVRTDAFNYPLGEHIVFADGQPLLSGIMRLIGIQEVPTAVAVVQLGPWIGAWLGAILLAALFVRLGQPMGLAMATGLGIALLSPQLLRVSGHFGLSYVFVLPALLHALLSWTGHFRWKWVGVLALLIVAFGQLHLYHVAIGTLLVGLYFGWSLPHQARAIKGRIVLQGLSLLVAIYAMTWLLVEWPWPISDRPPAPHGILAAITRIEDVFIDRELAWWRWFNGHVTKIKSPGSPEGFGYVGIYGGLFAAGAALALLWLGARKAYASLVHKRRQAAAPDRPALFSEQPAQQLLWLWGTDVSSRDRHFLNGILFAGFVSGLLAIGLPFSIPAIGDVGESIGFLRQFRALGRFIWIWYYVLLIAAYMWAYLRFWRKPDLRWLAIGCTMLLLLEGTSHLRHIGTNPYPLPWGERAERWLAAIGPIEDYQAVLPVPYFHEGGETFNAPLGQADFSVSTQVSLLTGLPSLAVAMSRQSNAATFDRLPFDHVWTDVPPVLREISGKGKVLVTVSRQQLQTSIETRAGDPYSACLAACDTLLVDDNFVLLSMSTDEANLLRLAQAACRASELQVTDIDTLGGRPRPGFTYLAGPIQITADMPHDGAGWYEVARWPAGDTAALDVTWTTELEGTRRPRHSFRLERLAMPLDSQTFAAEVPAASWTTVLQAEGTRVRLQAPNTPKPSDLRLRVQMPIDYEPSDTLRIRHLSSHPSGRIWSLRLADGTHLIDGQHFMRCTD